MSLPTLVIDIDASVIRLEAVKKAAYRFGASFFADIALVSPTQIRVTMQPRSDREDPVALVGEFKNEALDQELREVVAKETEAVRNLILAQAFSKTGLLDPVGESADYRVDPLRIA